MSLLSSSKSSGRLNTKWICAIIVGALFCLALRDFKSFHSPSSINAPPLFFIQGPAQPAVSLSLPLFCENKSWSYEQIPFSSESYLEELYRSVESTLFRALFSTYPRCHFPLDNYFPLTATLSFTINMSIKEVLRHTYIYIYVYFL